MKTSCFYGPISSDGGLVAADVCSIRRRHLAVRLPREARSASKPRQEVLISATSRAFTRGGEERVTVRSRDVWRGGWGHTARLPAWMKFHSRRNMAAAGRAASSLHPGSPGPLRGSCIIPSSIRPAAPSRTELWSRRISKHLLPSARHQRPFHRLKICLLGKCEWKNTSSPIEMINGTKTLK